MDAKKLLCNVDDCCFIVIDIQEKLTQSIPQKVNSRLRANTSILLKTANQLNIPVIATAQYPQGLGPIEKPILDELSDTAKCFEKTSFSCLGADGFAEHLKNLNKKQVVLVGIEAHICVLQTAFDLIAEDYEVFVVTDTVASRKLTNYESAIIRINQSGAHMVNTESVVFEWIKDASHPDFKAISKLII